MPSQQLPGGRALALGALEAGVRLVTGYPGSPSSEVVEAFIGLAGDHGVLVEWASNERVALEMGIGVSIAGRRALVCTKSVGMNVMVDPLMTLALTPTHGGLVVLLGDDPGGYGSQNDQDTRLLAPMLEMPLLEPATPAEGLAMMREAFDLSERFRTPVIVRETRSFAQCEGMVEISEGPHLQPDLGLAREPWRFVPVPSNVVKKHRELHERLGAVAAWAEGAPYHRATGAGDLGIVAAGFAWSKLIDVLGADQRDDLRVLRLGILHPLPEVALGRFLSSCREVLVLEETEPFVEGRLGAIAHDMAAGTRILGKRTGHLRPEGELFRWQIREELARWLPGIRPARDYRPEDEAAEQPRREKHCIGSRYDEVLDALDAAARALGRRPILVGDPGCLVTVADWLDAKYALGSAVGVADGLSKAGAGERVVALFGDSAFFHSALSAICHAVAGRSRIMMVVLDNGSTRTSGHQPHPGVGRDALGRPAPALSIERIALACGVEQVRSVGLDEPGDRLREAFRDGLLHPGLALIVVRIPTGETIA